MPEELRTAGYSLRPLALKDSLHIELPYMFIGSPELGKVKIENKLRYSVWR
jgi:hypothetical protein